MLKKLETPSSLGLRRSVNPPKGGWKEKTIYLVHVAFSSSNVIHEALYQTGYLNDKGVPGGRFLNYQDKTLLSEVYWLAVVEELPERFQVERI